MNHAEKADTLAALPGITLKENLKGGEYGTDAISYFF